MGCCVGIKYFEGQNKTSELFDGYHKNSTLENVHTNLWQRKNEILILMRTYKNPIVKHDSNV